MTPHAPMREVCRYLGYRGIAPDEAVAARARTLTEELEAKALPRYARQTYDLKEVTDNTVSFADITIPSKHLAKNLKGCTKVVLFCATIGPEADRMVRRAELTSVMDAAICQAAGAALVEDLCDLVNEEIKEEAARQGFRARPRFSPGYGDTELTLQRDFERLLQMQKTCGITLLDSLLMVPTKSVTAFVGLGPCEENQQDVETDTPCRVCTKTDCAYRGETR